MSEPSKYETLDFLELERLLIKEFEKIKNTKVFCNTHNISHSQYIIISQIVNKRNKKRYPELVIRLLELFDYEVEFKAVYKIRKLKPDDSNNVE